MNIEDLYELEKLQEMITLDEIYRESVERVTTESLFSDTARGLTADTAEY